MLLFASVVRLFCPRCAVKAGALGVLLLTSAAAAEDKVLHIGASESLHAGPTGSKEKVALESLRSLIKMETGLDNDIVDLKNWRDIAERMSKGSLQVGVFPGHEFAWAQEKYPKIKPLALAVNTYHYPIACLVVAKDSTVKDFAGLAGKPFALSIAEGSHVRLFVDRQAQAAGKKPDAFFSKITAPDNIEDALDDVVDGTVQATVVDRAGLETYKRRKPGRFEQLRELARSPAFPPTVIAYYDTALDAKTIQRFRDGLMGASRKEKGQTLLTFFRLTGFEGIPKDFDLVVSENRKAYPPDGETK
jgi:ABC-type phosphate/phosphonate transport system substrate-binding protein